MVIKKSSDYVFIDPEDVLLALVHPTRKMRNACQITTDGAGCVAAFG